MTDEQYFAVECLSVSRLGVVKCLRDGAELPRFSNQDALDFGKQFHQAVLEPSKYELALMTDPTYKKHRHKIAEMVKACKDNAVLCELLEMTGEVEKVHFFKEPRYGLECKIKMDKFIPSTNTILDLKSTAAKTREEFKESIIKYGYDRQAAFYLDGKEADRFVIVGVSKTFPHKTFTEPFGCNHELIEQGRIEIEELIDHYLSMPVKPKFNFLM